MWRSLPSTSQRAKVVKTSPLRAVADVALLAVEHPGAVGLLDRARLDVVGVRARLGLGQREAGELAPGGEVGQEALLLLVGAEHVDALEADRLVDAEHDRQRRVDLGEGLEDARVAGLREALAAVAARRRRGRRARPRRARGSRRRRSSASPRSCAWSIREPISRAAAISAAHPLLLGRVGLRPREDQVLVDLAQKQGLGERGARLLGPRLLHPCLGRGLHQREGTLPRAGRPDGHNPPACTLAASSSAPRRRPTPRRIYRRRRLAARRGRARR